MGEALIPEQVEVSGIKINKDLSKGPYFVDGKDTLANPNFASKGPKTKIPALIVFTKLYDAKFFCCFELSIIVWPLLVFIFAPNDCKRESIVLISRTLGKFLSIILLLDSNVAARIGSEAFLDPEILICPLSLFAPKTSNFCIIKL